MRTTIFTTAAALVVSVIAVNAHAETGPTPGWAHAANLVHLQENGKAITTDNVQDRLLIQEVFARWGVGYDEGRLDVIRSLFTPDAVYEVTLAGKKLMAHKEGPDNIVAGVRESLRQQGDQRRHAISNIIIDRLTANEATAIAYGIVTVAADGMSLGATVIYSANLRRGTDGVWRFSKFVIGMDEYAARNIVNKP